MPFDAAPPAEVTARDRVIRLRDFLDALPDERFDMDDYLVWNKCDGPSRYNMPIGKAVNICGTAACIAGWAQALFDPDTPQDEDIAARLLGLNSTQASALFIPDSRGVLTRAQAVATLDHYLATGEIDWAKADEAGRGKT